MATGHDDSKLTRLERWIAGLIIVAIWLVVVGAVVVLLLLLLG